MSASVLSSISVAVIRIRELSGLGVGVEESDCDVTGTVFGDGLFAGYTSDWVAWSFYSS